MVIFIPMAGLGHRYLRDGYTEPKPLIPVDGVAMIERVVNGFPKDARFVFAINRHHAEHTALPDVLERLRPSAKVVVIEAHQDGPVQTVLACAGQLPDDEDVLLNYCDFGVDWSFEDFALWLDRGGFDGAMTAYRGFHPHSIGPTLYAYMRHEGERVIEIREKHHFTPEKIEEYASSGLYYFRSGREFKRLSRELVDRGERVNGEFYVSMVMQLLVEQGGHVGVYPLTHFYQWGTPEDLRDYESWGRAMRGLDRFVTQVAAARSRAAQVLPMAGRGQRFAGRGYEAPKPLIDVAGRPMFAAAIACLPMPTARVLVAQKDLAADPRFERIVRELPSATRVEVLDHVTEGQACTAQVGVLAGKDTALVDSAQPILVAACDAGYVFDVDEWLRLEGLDDWELVVVSARDHLPARWRPAMYGWLQVERGYVTKVSVKKLVDQIGAKDQEVITGTFLFKDQHVFRREYDALIAAGDRVNGEFYLDTIARRMVEQGRRVRAFTVDKYMPFGTPEELNTFLYWNAVFRGGRRLGVLSA